MPSKITEDDRAYRKFVDTVFGTVKPKVAVGIFEADGQEDAGEGVTLIEVACWNEFGTDTIPARSFIRAWFDENQEKIRKALVSIISTEFAKAADGKPADVNRAVEVFGLWCVGEIQRRIAAGIPPENAASTIAKKGSSKPLVNKGQLRSSITYAIDWGNGTLKEHKSEATHKREGAARAAAKEQRKVQRRKVAIKQKARKKVVAKARKVVKSVLRDARKGGKTFLRRAKKAVRKRR